MLARHKREESVMMRKVEEGALTDAAPGARNDPHRLPTAPPSPATAIARTIVIDTRSSRVTLCRNARFLIAAG